MSLRVAILDQATRGQPTRLVVNVIMLDDMSQVPEGFDGIESDVAGTYDNWDGEKFTSPEQ